MKNHYFLFFITLSIFCFVQCKTEMERPEITVEKRFTELPAAYTGIDFDNQLAYTEDFNPYIFRNFFNGGGVGLGDVNNDGLLDIYFCGNLVNNELYINRGDWQFENITSKAGVACADVWSSGVSMVDINADGWLDIYVCKSGAPGGKNRHNELFINDGNPDEQGRVTFTEQAKKWGIADEGLSTHAAFFDYDRDGDLDCYLLNNSMRPVGNYDLRPDQRNKRDSLGGNKLYRNDGETFTDVSEKAGIYGSNIGFGLGVTIGDINRDGWTDIYVSNDFFERDYLYLNNQDGTFTEAIEEYLRELSLSSMGADMADVNNDGYPELFVTDMLPEGNRRMKTKTTFENWDKYQLNQRNGYYRQFTRNVLQLNQGKIGKNKGAYFSEISRFAGVEATDWSWGALIADLDNDGYKDIFVANGIAKDLTDQDYVQFFSDARNVRAILQEKGAVITEMVDKIPSEKLPNYAFQNDGKKAIPTFTNKAEEWGLNTPSFSNGSAYGDIDNDGDLDLIINNSNMPPFIYRNETDSLSSNYNWLKIKLLGGDKNKAGLGSQVTIFADGQQFYQEVNPMRGFESTVDARLHFGLGEVAKIDSVIVNWYDGKTQKISNITLNKVVEIDWKKASQIPATIRPTIQPIFTENKTIKTLFKHQENDFTDFDRDRLINQMLSAAGPKTAVADVNKDGRDDYYICGAKGQAGALFLQNANGQFIASNTAIFKKDKTSEDTDCLFFDANNDGHIDLYVASGGNEFSASSSALKDRLYLNDGRGNFTKSKTPPLRKNESTACIAASDFDGDGDMDLLLGVRLRPFLYGVPVSAFLLENQGDATFKDVTKTWSPTLTESGLFTDAIWLDIDKDGDEDLFLTGEWMSPRLFQNDGKKLTEITEKTGLKNKTGFWTCLEKADLDGDGDMDIIAGNWGQNNRFHATEKEPMQMLVNDFDGNGRAEQIISAYNGGTAYPLPLRHDLVMQMPAYKKKYLKYESYKNATINDLFTEEQINTSVQWSATETRSGIFWNEGETWRFEALPDAAQLSPIFGILAQDFDKDGAIDLLLGGNFHYAKPEIGINDANYGCYLKGDGKGNFQTIKPQETGFFVQGEIRDLKSININNQATILVVRNDDTTQFFELK